MEPHSLCGPLYCRKPSIRDPAQTEMIIAYCIDSIHGVGGIQHVTLTKANALADCENNSVWIFYADHSGQMRFPLSPKVHAVDLGINYYEDDWKSRWNVLKGIFIKRRIHQKRLEEKLREIQPDIVISVGQSEKNFLPRIRGAWATIREFHFTRNYRLLNANGLFERLLARAGNAIDYFSLRKYDRIVTLTQEDREDNWHGNTKVSVIPNPTILHPERISALDTKRVIASGRLTQQKNYMSLIRAYSLITKRFPDWTLDIYGDGPEREALLAEIHKTGMDKYVHLNGNADDMEEKMLASSILALSSRFEGLPTVMLEALSCSIPVVAYACPCGPKDILQDGDNGFLVPPDDEDRFAEKLGRLMEDDALRKSMGAAALKRANDFSVERIVSLWMALFKEILKSE